MAVEITNANYEELVAGDKPVVIDFWAEWCGPCRMVAPHIEALAEEFGERAVIGKCDVDENNDVATKYGVRNIPTIIFVKGGQVVDKQVGFCAKEVLAEKLTKIL